MSLLSSNIRALRRSKGLTQAEFAIRIGVNRSVIGAYEEGRAEPRLQTLQTICHFFGLSLDDILNQRFETAPTHSSNPNAGGQNLRILPIVVSQSDEEERILLVPEKASAGYAQGYADTEYIGNLPQFNLPFPELKAGKTYRVFQIRGESMLPLPSGTYIICEYLTDWNLVRDNQCYVLLTRNDGIVYKRVENRIQESGTLYLVSDNSTYEPFTVHIDDVLEVWKATGSISFELPDNNMAYSDLHRVMRAITDIQKDMSHLKQKL